MIKTLSSGTEARICSPSTLRKSSPRQKTTTLYEWKSKEEKEKEIRNQGFNESPNRPDRTGSPDPSSGRLPTVTVLPSIALRRIKFSKTRGRFLKPNSFRIRQNHGVAKVEYWAMALVALGKPKHREIVRNWVRSSHCPRKPPTGAIEPGSNLAPWIQRIPDMAPWF